MNARDAHRLGRQLKAAVIVATACALLLHGSTSPAAAAPLRGSTGWAILLCQPSDRPTVPAKPDFFQSLFTESGAGSGGLADYWRDVSYGAINLSGSVVRGWYKMPFTYAQEMKKDRWQVTEDCVQTARKSSTQPFDATGFRVAVVVNAGSSSGGPGSAGPLSSAGRVLIDSGEASFWESRTLLAHEMGHNYGLDHSYLDNGAEYGDAWDLMSCRRCFWIKSSHRFGWAGPGLIAPLLEQLGWIPWDRIYTYGLKQSGQYKISLAALNHPEAYGYLMARVPFDTQDPQHYYTIEFRRNDGWDAAIPRPTLLIHEVKDGRSYLLHNPNVDPTEGPVQELDVNGVRIKKISTSRWCAPVCQENMVATITIEAQNFRPSVRAAHLQGRLRLERSR